MSADAEEILHNLTGDLEPVRKLVSRYEGARASSDLGSDVLLLSHRPNIGELAYAIEIFAGVSDALIATYETLHDFTVPDLYRGLLMKINGANLFDLSLYGIPLSMAKDPPLLDRSGRSPLDLATAQKFWIVGYKVTPGALYFGGAPYSYTENVGYFLFPQKVIQSVRKNGAVVGEWRSFKEFLRDELARAEAAFPAHEEAMAAINEEIHKKKTAHKNKRSK
jgi:hypothetical protein